MHRTFTVRPVHCLLCFTDSQRSLVVLRLQAHRVLRYILLHPPEEGEPADLPARVPPLHNVLTVVDRHQVGPQRLQ